MLLKLWIIVCLILLMPIIGIAQEDSAKLAELESIKNIPDTIINATTLLSDRYVITYYHGNRRCATCQKLEDYASESVEKGLAEELKSGKVVWQTLNFDEEANEHVKKDYGIFSQAVIVSHIVDDKEIEWTNLDKIWTLVSDKEKYVEYVQTEAKEFMAPKKKE